MWGGFNSQDGPNQFSSMVQRQGAAVPTQPRSPQPAPNPAQRTPGQTPWGAQMQPHQGGRGGFGQPNPGAMAQKPFGGSPWSLANQNPKQAQMLGNGQSPFPGFEPQTGGPNLQFPRPDAIPPGPPGGSYGQPEGWVNRPNDIIPPGPAGQSYGPVDGLGAIPPGPPQGYGPFDPNSKPGQITGAIPPGLANFGQMFPGASPFAQRILGRMPIPQGNPNPIPPGPAGQSYGPSDEFLGRPDNGPGGWEWGALRNRGNVTDR